MPPRRKPNVLPPLNSPEYVELAGKIAENMGLTRKAPRTYILAERTKAEAKYRRLIDEILRMADEKLALIAEPTEADILSVFSALAASPALERMSQEAARQMVTMLAVGQKRTWRLAASASSNGRAVFSALRKEASETAIGQAVSAAVAENAALIKTVPQTVARKLTVSLREKQIAGTRPETLTQEIMSEAEHLREFEAKRIARTETAKAATALTEARAESLGLDFYVWRSARDERVRDSHTNMNGVICRWSDPPDPESLNNEKRSYGRYHPGSTFNCRCIALPIVDLSDINFPCKAHRDGSIVKVNNLAQFKKLFGLEADK